MNWIKSVLCYWFRYVVQVQWEDACITHHAWNQVEAVEWMSCYPKTGVLCVVYAHTEMIATRG